MHPEFIEMHASASIPGLRVLVCGDGPALSTLKIQAKQTGQPERFEFLGFQTEPKQILAKADLFGYPLADENYATSELALQEAMYLGIPPLLLARNGPALMLEEGETGMLARNPSDYTKKLVSLACSPEVRTRLGQNAAAFARRNWGSHRTAKQMLSVYHRLMVNAKRTAAPLSSDRDHPGAHRFIRSLGDSAAQFRHSLEEPIAKDEALLEIADKCVAESSLLLSSASAGGVLHYRFSYPQDKYLRYWSGLVLAKQGRNALAALEFSTAKKLGLNAKRLAPYFKQEACESTFADQAAPTSDQEASPPLGSFQQAFQRVRKGDGKVLFCGNSVTAQREGFRPRLEEWLHYGIERPNQILNAVLGGVGSFGCSFLFHNTLNQNRNEPALCFIECLSGDIGIKADPEEIKSDLESMLRRLLKRGSAVCLLFLYHHRWTTEPAKRLREVYQQLATFYEIPVIDIASDFQRMIETGDASEASLLRDGVHTTPAGSYLAFNKIASSLMHLDPSKRNLQEKHLPPRLFAAAETYLHTLNLMPSRFEHISESKWGLFRLANRYLRIELDESLDFTLEDGSLAGILFVNGPDSGGLTYSTLHSKNEYNLADKWSHYQRLHVLRLEEQPKSNENMSIRPNGLNLLGNPASLDIVALLIRSDNAKLPTITLRLNKSCE